MQLHLRPLVAALAVLVAILVIQSARANLLYYDSFDYEAGVGTNLSSASSNWVHSGGATEPQPQSVGSLTYPGLGGSGDSIVAQYDGAFSSGNSSHEIDSTGITDGTLYFSLLLKVPTVQVSGGNAFGTGSNLINGSFMAGFDTVAPGTAPATNTTAAALLIRSGDGTQTADTYQLGTSFTTNTADRKWFGDQANPNSSTNLTTGASAQTVLVVVKLTLDSTTATNQMAQLFVNPTVSNTEPGSADVTSAFDALFSANTGVRSFFFRNNSVEPDVMYVDELRVGTTWVDVMPEPASIGFFALGGLTLCGRRRRRAA